MLTMALRILQLNSARLFVGEAAHTLNLTEALRRAGHHVCLGLRKDQFTIEVARRRQLDPIEFNLVKRFWLPNELPDMRKLARLVRDEGIQLVHVHRSKEHWMSVLASRFHRLKVPIVRTRHVVTPLKKHAANRWLAKRTAKMITVSRAVEADVRSTRMYRDENLAFIPGGVDLEHFRVRDRRDEIRRELKLSSDAPVAVCVARFAKVKAHRVLLDAWAKVRRERPAAVLLLVGEGALRPEIEAQAERLGLSTEAVRFLGGWPNKDLPRLLESADVGVLASVGSEGFSRAVLEYLSMSRPVVATRVGAIPDLVTEGGSGRLVPPEDADALAGALSHVFRLSPGEREEMGRQGRAKAERDHSYACWAQTHVRLYENVIESGRAN
jgi:glycosyltransferase involved in cell wall biosynthesis